MINKAAQAMGKQSAAKRHEGKTPEEIKQYYSEIAKKRWAKQKEYGKGENLQTDD